MRKGISSQRKEENSNEFLVNMIPGQLKSFIQLNTTNHSELKKPKAKEREKNRRENEKKEWN